MKNSTSIIAAFIGGAVVGAAIALLIAPESGKDTRQKITDFLENNGLGSENATTDTADAKPESSPTSKK